MENIGVTCDVCACCHNVDGCKCDLPQIKVTEQCSCTTQQVETPHYCQSYEEKKVPTNAKQPLPEKASPAGAAAFYSINAQRSVTLQVARLRISVPTLSFIWIPAKPSAKAACTFSSLSSINTHSLAFS